MKYYLQYDNSPKGWKTSVWEGSDSYEEALNKSKELTDSTMIYRVCDEDGNPVNPVNGPVSKPSSGNFVIGYHGDSGWWHSSDFPEVYTFPELLELYIGKPRGVFLSSTYLSSSSLEGRSDIAPVYTFEELEELKFKTNKTKQSSITSSVIDLGPVIPTTLTISGSQTFNGNYQHVPPGYRLVKDEPVKPRVIEPLRTYVGRRFR